MVDVLKFSIEFSYHLALEFSVLLWGLRGRYCGLEWELEAEKRGCKVVVVMFEYVFPSCSPFGIIWTVFVRVKGVLIRVFNDVAVCPGFLIFIL